MSSAQPPFPPLTLRRLRWGALLAGILLSAGIAALLFPSPRWVVGLILCTTAAIPFSYLLRPTSTSSTSESNGEPDDLFGITLASIGDAVIATDIEGRVILLNEAATRLTGWPLEEARGLPLQKVFQIFHAHTREPCEDPVSKVLSTGQIVGLANHTTLRSRDGNEYQISDSGAPIRDAGGNLRGVVLVFSDVTRDYALRAALTASEERMRLAMSAAREGIWDLHIDSRESYASPRMFELIGKDPTAETIEAGEWMRRVHPEDLSVVEESYQSLLSGAVERSDLEYRLSAQPDVFRWVRSQSRITGRDTSGRPTRMTGVVEDIHERKLARLELSRREALLRAAQEAGDVGVIEMNFVEETVRISEELRVLHGQPKNLYTLAEVHDLCPEEDSIRFQNALQAAIAGDGIVEIEYRIRNSTTRALHWIFLKGRILRDTEGHPTGLLAAVLDTTARKLDELRLAELNAILQAIRRVNRAIAQQPNSVEIAQSAVEALVESRGCVCAWLLLLNGEGQPQSFLDAGFETPSDLVQLMVLENGQPAVLPESTKVDGVFVKLPPFKKDPTTIPVPASKEPIAAVWSCPLEYGGKRLGYLTAAIPASIAAEAEERVLFRELAEDLAHAFHSRILETERTETLEALIAAKERAESANRAKDEFLAVMSHEMRTPLNPIFGYTSLLLEEAEDVDSREWLITIRASAHRLLKLIEDILEYSRLSAGAAIEPTWQSVSVVELCEEVVEIAARNSALELRLKHPAQNLAPLENAGRVLLDPEMFRRILENLVENACKYTPKGNVTVELGQSPKGELCLTVRDTGIGISERMRESLFKPFSQADSSYSRSHEGAGLGLAICQRLTHLLGATLEVESSPGSGSAFHFRMPRHADASVQPSVASPSGTHEETLDRHALIGLRILVVDDNPSNGRVVQSILQRVGAEVICVTSGPAALDAFPNGRFHGVIMDLAMPGMDGIETMKRLRQENSEKNVVPIIVLSAHATEGDREQSLLAGAREHLTKPVNPIHLIDALQRALAS